MSEVPLHQEGDFIHVRSCSRASSVGAHLKLDAHPLAALLKQLEFGTSTGRQRMVGWYDAVEKGDALRYGGFQDVMINKLDALTQRGHWRGDLLLCTAYEDAAGRRHHHVPRNEAVRKTLRPVYEQHPGWTQDVSQVRHFADLPPNARRYVAAMLRAMVEVAYRGEPLPAVLPNLRYLGVGPDPSQIIKDVPATAELVRL